MVGNQSTNHWYGETYSTATVSFVPVVEEDNGGPAFTLVFWLCPTKGIKRGYTKGDSENLNTYRIGPFVLCWGVSE
jgi:hypothetical protein